MTGGRRLARDESGFTLIELLTAAAIGMIVIGAAFSLLDTTLRGAASSDARTDVAQRGRVAMDAVVQRVRSQVCLTSNGNSAVQSATATRLSFWSDLTGSDFAPSRPRPVLREIEYADGTLVERTRSSAGGPVISSRTLASGVAPIGSTQIFRYWSLSDPDSVPRTATVPLASPISSALLPSVARVTIAFAVAPERQRGGPTRAEFEQDVYIRSVDYSRTGGTVRCTN